LFKTKLCSAIYSVGFKKNITSPWPRLIGTVF
jgi:hypothetical protein